MVLKRKKTQKNKKSKITYKKGLRPVIASAKLSNLLEGSLATVNEISKGLSVAMPNQELLKGYSNVLDLQKSAFEQVTNLNEILKGSTAQLTNIMSDILAPVSATITEIGLATANASQLFNLEKINESVLLSVQKLSGLCLDTIQEQQRFTLSSLQAIEDSNNLNRFISDCAASIQMITNGLDGVIRSIPAFPSVLNLPALEVIRERTFITEGELTEHQEKLDNFLREIDPDLIEFRLGCWGTFRAKGWDYIGQASSSMRRLIDKVLRHIAPDEEVISTEYFKASPEAKTRDGRPTRRARIYCATDYDRKKAKHLKRLATGFLSAYNNLSTWDHKPEKRHDFVYGSFVAVEGYLLSLLSVLKRKK